ncbi:MAG: DegV family protein [Clostridia bacterium]|nr:DegV family protein [Clostridia bacterium]
MNKVALIIDNSGYFSKQDVERYNVQKLIPISFIINGDEYYEGQNMTYQDFYQFLADKNTIVSTSQPSIETIKEGWREILKDYEEIVYIPLSSGLSEACNTAINASHEDEFEGKVFVVNNQKVAYLHKASVIEASKLISDGKSAKEVKDYLESTKSECGVYIGVDTLKYLKKGGRVTPAAAAIGTLLNIKPILQIHGGKLDAFAKTMSMKQARAKMIAATKKEVEERFPEELKEGKIVIGMAHTFPNLDAQEIKDFEADVKAALPEMSFFTHDPLPLFVACHTGPNCMAVGYYVDRLGVLKDYQK